jgi:hypothetical protein
LKFSCLLLLADFLHQFHVRVSYIHVCGYCTATLTCYWPFSSL